jgi:hypothetical protein
MMSRVQLMLAGALTLWAGAGYATPPEEKVMLANRAQQVAARMSQLESYDRATRAIPLAGAAERDQAIAEALEKGRSYRQARGEISEQPGTVNARWSKHQLAMQDGGSHEAGWAASARP